MTAPKPNAPSSPSATDTVDVAIVGGGVSGVYSGWRLLTDSTGSLAKTGTRARALSVSLFEMSRRIGGRLLSLTPPGMPHIRCELGGMRYGSTQDLVRSLVEHKLKLAHHAFPVDEDSNIAYLRGTHLRMSELANPARVPYRLRWAERGKTPGEQLAAAVEQVVPGVTTLTGKRLMNRLKQIELEGRPLYDWGFWNLLARTMSREAYDYTFKASGYDAISRNWNAVDTIYFMFGGSAEATTYRAVTDGYESLPTTLCRLFEGAGGVVRLGCRLVSFDYDTKSGVRMVVRRRDGDRECDEIVQARHLVLAMPRRSLELIEPSGAVLSRSNRHVHAMIRSVSPIPSLKIFGCYRSPWWEDVGVKSGRSVTDLPVRQCYYWGVEGQQSGADPTNRNAAILATYDEEPNVGFWDGLRDWSTSPDARSTGEPALDSASSLWRQYQAPRPMRIEVHRQLKEIHGVRFAEEPYDAVYMDWSVDPFGGGVNAWKIHAKSWEVIPAIVQPLPDVPVYICGEAYSANQGWVEGALQTAELMLQRHFHLSAPDWVVPSPDTPSHPEGG